MIYLNYCADTPVSREVLERFCEAAGILGSANARHAAGYAARAVVDAAASDTAALLCVDPTEIIFTSGATESNNLAVKGLALANLRTGRHIVSTPMEHSSVSAPLAALERNGWKVELADVGRDGKIDLNAFERMIRPDTALVAVSAVSSELGAVQPIAEISEIVRRFPGCRLHVDAAQAVGKTELDFRLADTVSFSPHKFYGLTGVGVLYKRYGAELEPQMHGGASTTVYRSGTPAAALAASTVPALRSATEELPARRERVAALNARLRAELTRYPLLRVNSPEDAVPHILNVSVEGVKGTRMQRALDGRGVCVSVKSACASDGLPSREVLAVTGDSRRALSSFRISLSHLTTDAEIDGSLAAFDECYEVLTKKPRL